MEIHEIATYANSGLLFTAIGFLIKFLMTDHIHRSELDTFRTEVRNNIAAVSARIDSLVDRLIQHEKKER